MDLSSIGISAGLMSLAAGIFAAFGVMPKIWARYKYKDRKTDRDIIPVRWDVRVGRYLLERHHGLFFCGV